MFYNFDNTRQTHSARVSKINEQIIIFSHHKIVLFINFITFLVQRKKKKDTAAGRAAKSTHSAVTVSVTWRHIHYFVGILRNGEWLSECKSDSIYFRANSSSTWGVPLPFWNFEKWGVTVFSRVESLLTFRFYQVWLHSLRWNLFSCKFFFNIIFLYLWFKFMAKFVRSKHYTITIILLSSFKYIICKQLISWFCFTKKLN